MIYLNKTQAFAFVALGSAVVFAVGWFFVVYMADDAQYFRQCRSVIKHQLTAPKSFELVRYSPRYMPYDPSEKGKDASFQKVMMDIEFLAKNPLGVALRHKAECWTLADKAVPLERVTIETRPEFYSVSIVK